MRIFQRRGEAERWLELNVDQTPPGFIMENGTEAVAALRNVI